MTNKLDNLKPFKPGESGNPNGRPKGRKNFSTLFEEALIRLGQKNDKDPADLELEIIEKGIAMARKGDYRFYKDTMDRVHGSAIHNHDLKTGGVPMISVSKEIAEKHDLNTSPESNSQE